MATIATTGARGGAVPERREERTGLNPLTRLNAKTQLLIWFIVLVLPVFLLNWYADEKATDLLKNQMTDAYIELIRQNHEIIERDLDSIHKMTTAIIQDARMQQMADRPGETTSERVRKYSDLDRMLAGIATGLDGAETIAYSFMKADPNGDYDFAPSYRHTRRGVFFVAPGEAPEWFQEAIRMKGRSFLRVIDNFGPGRSKTLAFIRAVNDIRLGQPIGVLIATNVEAQLNASLNKVLLPKGKIVLTDMRNALLAGTDGAELGATAQLPPMRPVASHRGTLEWMDDDAIYIANINYAQQHQLVYEIPIHTLTRKQNELRWMIQTTSAVYFVLCLLVMFYFLRSLVQPLHNMAQFFKSYEPGKIFPVFQRGYRKDEVGVLANSMHGMTKRLKALIEEKYVMELREKETQLQLLYEQINPHLLYNTLESIYWKSSLQGDAESAEMIKDLSKLMKIGLSRGKDLIRMEEECEHAKAYVSLQQKRYNYGFQVTWDIPDDVLRLLIPKITLQPIIENAIVHGIRNMGDDGELIVTARLERHHWEIRVEDNGYKEADLDAIRKLLDAGDDPPVAGYGIRNVHRRIRMHFGEAYGLRYDKREPQGIAVTITLPIRPDSEATRGDNGAQSVDRR